MRIRHLELVSNFVDDETQKGGKRKVTTPYPIPTEQITHGCNNPRCPHQGETFMSLDDHGGFNVPDHVAKWMLQNAKDWHPDTTRIVVTSEPVGVDESRRVPSVEDAIAQVPPDVLRNAYGGGLVNAAGGAVAAPVKQKAPKGAKRAS